MKIMAKYGILLALLFVGGCALPVSQDDGPGFDEDLSIFDNEMSIFFDHTVTDAQGRIIGGNNAANGAYPWMVAMTNGASRNFLCGASMVTNRHILTAAHCNAAAAPGGHLSTTLRIVVGTNRWNRGGQTYSLQRHINHPHYNANTIKNDIGILIAASNIATNNLVRAIPISYDFVGGNVPSRVSGWGLTRTTAGFNSNYLQELNVNTVEGQRCIADMARVGQSINTRPPPVNVDIEICTFLALNRGTCNGDSGSALVRNSNNHQIGIVSWGLPCARGAPDVFARVSAFRTWLQQNLR